MSDPPPVPEKLTPEQYEKIAPLLKLADHGNPVKLAETLKPGETKRRELKARALTALREHGTLTHAAAGAGVTPYTLYRWRQSDPAFDAEVTEFLHVDMLDQLHQSMFSIATNPDPKVANAAVRALEFLMKSEDRDKFGDQLKTDTTVTVNQQVDVTLRIRDQHRTEFHQLRARMQAIRDGKADVIDAEVIGQGETT